MPTTSTGLLIWAGDDITVYCVQASTVNVLARENRVELLELRRRGVCDQAMPVEGAIELCHD